MNQPVRTTRRTLLRVGLGGTALLTLGGVALELQPTARLPVPDALRALSPKAFRVLVAAADRICPGNGTTLPKASELGVPELIDTLVATLHPADQTQVGQLLGLLESPLAGLATGGRIRPFTQLAPEAQDAVLLDWQQHRWSVLRQSYRVLRNLVATTYHVQPKVFAAIGYPGPPDYGQADAPAVQPRQAQQETG